VVDRSIVGRPRAAVRPPLAHLGGGGGLLLFSSKTNFFLVGGACLGPFILSWVDLPTASSPVVTFPLPKPHTLDPHSNQFILLYMCGRLGLVPVLFQQDRIIPISRSKSSAPQPKILPRPSSQFTHAHIPPPPPLHTQTYETGGQQSTSAAGRALGPRSSHTSKASSRERSSRVCIHRRRWVNSDGL
jgi:hypothetical protein